MAPGKDEGRASQKQAVRVETLLESICIGRTSIASHCNKGTHKPSTQSHVIGSGSIVVGPAEEGDIVVGLKTAAVTPALRVGDHSVGCQDTDRLMRWEKVAAATRTPREACYKRFDM